MTFLLRVQPVLLRLQVIGAGLGVPSVTLGDLGSVLRLLPRLPLDADFGAPQLAGLTLLVGSPLVSFHNRAQLDNRAFVRQHLLMALHDLLVALALELVR